MLPIARRSGAGLRYRGAGSRAMSCAVAAVVGLVAVGSEESGGEVDAAVWTSPDGLTWCRVSHDEAVFSGLDYQSMFGVVVGGPGLVAVGESNTGGDHDGAICVAVPVG
jgi:hypothetical protein